MSGIFTILLTISAILATISFVYGWWVLENNAYKSEMRYYVLASTIMFPTTLVLSILFVSAKVYSKSIPTVVMGFVKFFFDVFILFGTLLAFAVIVWGTYLLPTNVQCLDSAIFSATVLYVVAGWFSFLCTALYLITSDRYKYSSEEWFNNNP